MKRLSWLAALARLALLALSGCASLSGDPFDASVIDWSERASRLSSINQWEFSGRLAVKDLVNGDGTQASVRWWQQAQHSTVRLSGPFGAATQEIHWEPEQVRIVDADGEHAIEYTGAQAAERFLHDQLGWSFPVESTRFWLRALRDPGAPGQEIFSQDGTLIELNQHGWQIRYERYVASDGIMMPSRLVMQSSSARLRIVISKWRMTAAGERSS